MNWFDILKLGGEDLGGVKYLNLGNENPMHNYDDNEQSEKVADYFYNLENVATTRPHFEHQAKHPKKKGFPIEGDLGQIVNTIGKVGSGKYYSFTDPTNSTYVITYKVVEPDFPYPKTRAILKPSKLGNTSNVIVFDSVYPTSSVSKLNNMANFNPIWPNDDERIKMFDLTPEEKKDMRLERSDAQRKIDKHKRKMKNPKANKNFHREEIKKLEKRKEEINMLLGGRDDFDTSPKRRRRRQLG